LITSEATSAYGLASCGSNSPSRTRTDSARRIARSTSSSLIRPRRIASVTRSTVTYERSSASVKLSMPASSAAAWLSAWSG
jgi:hypothetical protein